MCAVAHKMIMCSLSQSNESSLKLCVCGGGGGCAEDTGCITTALTEEPRPCCFIRVDFFFLILVTATNVLFLIKIYILYVYIFLFDDAKASCATTVLL